MIIEKERREKEERMEKQIERLQREVDDAKSEVILYVQEVFTQFI